MHKNFSYAKRILPPGAGCFLGRSVLLVELIRFLLCLGLFLCLQAHVGKRHMQENDFIKAWCHHSVIAGCIDAQHVVKLTKEPASQRCLLQLPQPLSSALSSVLGPFTLPVSRCWDESHAGK